MMTLVDGHNRRIDYLRISITDHCNLNCLYCAPLRGRPRLLHEEVLSYEEIGKTMNLSTQAVKSLLSRARCNLRDILQPYIQMGVKPAGDPSDKSSPLSRELDILTEQADQMNARSDVRNENK